MSITRQERADLIRYRIEQAQNAIADAEYAALGQRWTMAANRLYYAVFYAASALLLSEEISFHTHKGLINQFGYYFVKAGRVTFEEGALVSQLFGLRHETDYEAYLAPTQEQIEDYLPKTRALIDKLVSLNKMYEKVLEKKNNLANARKMKDDGMSIELIEKYTGLTREEIMDL